MRACTHCFAGEDQACDSGCPRQASRTLEGLAGVSTPAARALLEEIADTVRGLEERPTPRADSIH